MKKNKFLLLVAGILAVLFAVPCQAEAKTVNVYFFRSNSCGYCAAAKEFFETLKEDEEYKDLFEIKDFEVSSTKNSNLMYDAAEIMGDTLRGVPYIVIGDESWNGYSSTYDEDLKEKIKEVSSDENFEDPLATLIADFEAGGDDGLIILGIIAGVLVVVGVGIYFARKDTDKLEKAIALEAKKEEPKEEIKEVKAEKKTTSKPKTTTKKTTTKKTTTTAKKKTSTKKTTKK